ncbi:MAG: family 3 adenylate cyclase [Elusimicrobiota bacterium]|jgi:hypothetical protein|nr:family 3 adenylate cyclase [Elusimicrobiota bacterium]
MNTIKKQEIESIVIQSLKRAEELWDNTLEKDKELNFSKKASKTNIPGNKYLGEDEYKSDCFLAFMIDMRDSTQHLIQAISAKISQMQRVFYEVSALLPAMAKIIEDADGGVTEYLGDGLLALFQFPADDKHKKDNVCRNVITVANDCLYALQEIVNPILNCKYGLPPLEIGIGMSYSQSIITHFGVKPNTQIKVIGRCIYDVSKLSKERNKIAVDKTLQLAWPSSEGGKLRFEEQQFDDNLIGFIVSRDD